MVQVPAEAYDTRVALLAEGVDRNYSALMKIKPIRESPSSRRAWIEIKGWATRPGAAERRLPPGKCLPNTKSPFQSCSLSLV